MKEAFRKENFKTQNIQVAALIYLLLLLFLIGMHYIEIQCTSMPLITKATTLCVCYTWKIATKLTGINCMALHVVDMQSNKTYTFMSRDKVGILCCHIKSAIYLTRE